MRVVIVTIQAPFIRGGSEVLAESLRERLRQDGHEAEIVAVPWDGDDADSVLAGIHACRELDLERLAGGSIDRVIGLKFPAYLVRHPRKVLWLIHQHHAAYERWDSPFGLVNSPDGRLARAAVMAADRELRDLARGSVFAISRTVAQRLGSHCGVAAKVLYPPPRYGELFHTGEDLGYFFFPSRLTAIKRHALVLEALAACRRPCRVLFAGAADHPALERELRAMAVELGLAERVEWRGRVSDEDLRALYAQCRAVIFPPHDEDYGYVTLEAMLAHRPVLTCQDSGGTLEFVVDGETGLVVPPQSVALATALDRLAADPQWAAALGERGHQRLQALEVGWPSTIAALLGEGAT
jgi:glycosyltransferase involved in cell wall biosynthesis